MSEDVIKVYVPNEWLSGETCTFNIDNYIDRMRANAYLNKIRGAFLDKLRSEGFKIIFNSARIDENTICLVMDPNPFGKDVSLDDWRRLLYEKIAKSGGEYFKFPYSVPLKDYFLNPFFPAVFKNEATNGGEDKFLIENSEQLAKIKEFYDKYYATYKTEFDSVICQQLIETPTVHATYMRVLVGGTGEVMGASLKYSKASANKNITGIFEKEFLVPSSPYFIGAKKMFNYYSGGGNISLFKPYYSKKELTILKEHGFDINNIEVSDTVREVCQNIMMNCNREIGVLCGIDFILNKQDNMWYYLENQAFPAIDEWALRKGIKLPSGHDVNGYLEVCNIELQARYEAFMSLVNARKEAQGLKRVRELKNDTVNKD
ncbi:MAG: hypothetical protein NC483_00945 [Ruminococcus sp.]|nr:hypothetical protein [Ruminococcus sp.]